MCCPRNGVQVAVFPSVDCHGMVAMNTFDTASHFPIPLCVDAWEGQMVILVSPDTGQNK